MAVTIVLITCVYRFNTLGGPLGGFDNDHFTALTRSMAMLDGEQPLRDFVEGELRALWPPLTYSTSAAAQEVLGRSLRSEALLCIGMLALGAVVLFWTSAVMTGVMWPAAWATLLAVALSPALYNYPKIAPFAVTVVAMLAYARRQTRTRLLALAVTLVVAALFRHDHGVLLALTSGALLLFIHGRRAATSLVLLAAFVIVGLLPGIVFAERQGGFLAYLQACLTHARQEASRTVAATKALQFDWSQPLLTKAPEPEPPPRRVAVRWDPAVTDAARAAAENAFGLVDAADRGGGRSWSYVLLDSSPARLRAIIDDPRVADTDGIDRQRYVLTNPSGERAAQEAARRDWFPWRIAPGLLTVDNAAPWVYLSGWLVLLASATCVLWPPLRGIMTTPNSPPSLIGAICILGGLMFITLLRNPAPFRLADGSVPVVLLGAWLVAGIARVSRARRWPWRAAIVTALAVAMTITTLSIGAAGAVPEQVMASGIADGVDGGVTGAVTGAVTSLVRRWQTVWAMLGEMPASTAGIEDDLGRTAQYLRRCTLPSDRVLIDDYFPEIYYFADRRFAAGQPIFFGNFYTMEAAQRRAVERWQHQSVPIVLLRPAEQPEDAFAGDYPLVADYLHAHYRKAGSLAVRREVTLDVWIDTSRVAHPDVETGLPCFDDAGGNAYPR